jgi:membrane protein implicated in regulation of membrane protease activity
VDWTFSIEFWHWWVLASSLLVLELVWPRFVFLWLGFVAAAVGFLLLVFPSTPARAQVALFVLLSALAIAAWRHYRRGRARSSA